jgi:hypothetical protein
LKDLAARVPASVATLSAIENQQVSIDIELCLLKTPYWLQRLMLLPFADRLPADAGRPDFAYPDRAIVATVSSRAPARDPGVATPAPVLHRSRPRRLHRAQRLALRTYVHGVFSDSETDAKSRCRRYLLVRRAPDSPTTVDVDIKPALFEEVEQVNDI